MDIKQFYKTEGEKPLDRLVDDGGFAGIFRTIACIGDSLASGEFESQDPDGTKGYHDYYEFSWGQHMARRLGSKVYNFSTGGMSAAEYIDTFGDESRLWRPELAAQAYIIALGVNDIGSDVELGTTADIDLENYNTNKRTFSGDYARIIQRYKEISPNARFFCMTIPRTAYEKRNEKIAAHAEAVRNLVPLFKYTYVLDFERYAPVYDAEFRENFFLRGHMNPAGYLLTAKMVMSYIDYIVRNNPDDFRDVGFIGTRYHS